MHNVRDWRMWVLLIGVLGGVAGLIAAGFFIGQWQSSGERQDLLKRFPVVRAEAYKSGLAVNAAALDSLQKQLDAANARLGDFGDIKKLVQDSRDVSAYTLRYLGDRAKVTDAHNAILLKQTKVATEAAVDAKQTVEQVDKKVTANIAKVDAAASAVQSVEKKLSPPAPPPSKGWFGLGGH